MFLQKEPFTYVRLRAALVLDSPRPTPRINLPISLLKRGFLRELPQVPAGDLSVEAT